MGRPICLCAVFSILFSLTSTDKVPVLIWSNDRSLAVPHSLAGHTLTTDDFSLQYVRKLTDTGILSIVLFIQDKLSLSEITRNAAVFDGEHEDKDALKMIKEVMATMSVAQLSSVDNPVAAVADLKEKFAVESIYELVAPYQVSSLQLVPLQPSLIIVKLPETKTGESSYRKSLEDIDAIVGSVTNQLEKLSVKFAAIYTAARSADESNSFESLRTVRSSRQLLQTSDSSLPLGHVKGSFLFYADNLTVEVNQVKYSYSTDGGSWDTSGCDNLTSCVVSMVYNHSSTDETPALTLTMAITKTSDTGYWFVESFTVHFRNKTNAMSTSFVELTPLGFSYHCYPTTNITSTSGSVNLVLQNFQIQALRFKEDGSFGHYNDCVGFFTIPIWMGVISSLLLIAILLFGVIMLMDVKTMDRFDDPKGKTITVTATD